MPRNVRKETRRLDQGYDDIIETAKPEIKAVDSGMRRPWRIALLVQATGTEMIFDVTGPMIVGRAYPDSGFFPDIDLGAFNAGELGVSREHLTIKLDGERVVVEDNKSANGTQLNGEWLKPHQAYPIRNGDELTLGLLKLTFELLTNPYS